MRQGCRVQTGPRALERGPSLEERSLVRGVERGWIGRGRLRDAAQVLERPEPEPRGRDRVGQAQVPRDPEVEHARLVEQRGETYLVDPGVDLHQVGARVHQAVHPSPRLLRGARGDGVRIRRGDAVDHRPGGIHPRAGAPTPVQLAPQGERAPERPVHVADGGDAPREVAGQRPAGDPRLRIHQVHVTIHQPGDDPLPGEIHDRGALGELKVAPRSDRLDVAPPDDDRRLRQRRPPAPVDQRGAQQRHAVRLPRSAREDQTQPKGHGRMMFAVEHRLCGTRCWKVGSCRSPCKRRGPLGETSRTHERPASGGALVSQTSRASASGGGGWTSWRAGGLPSWPSAWRPSGPGASPSVWRLSWRCVWRPSWRCAWPPSSRGAWRPSCVSALLGALLRRALGRLLGGFLRGLLPRRTSGRGLRTARGGR